MILSDNLYRTFFFLFLNSFSRAYYSVAIYDTFAFGSTYTVTENGKADLKLLTRRMSDSLSFKCKCKGDWWSFVGGRSVKDRLPFQVSIFV